MNNPIIAGKEYQWKSIKMPQGAKPLHVDYDLINRTTNGVHLIKINNRQPIMALEVELICPKCGSKIQAIEWEDGRCEKCGNRYTWDEEVAEDFSDEWIIAIFESQYINSHMYNWYFGSK